MNVLKGLFDELRPAIQGILGTEQSRQEKVTSLLINKPFQAGADLGLYSSTKIPTPQLKQRESVYDLQTDLDNMAQDTEVFRKNLPANLSEIGTGLIDIAMNPVQSADTLLDITTGALRNIIPDDSLLAQGLDKTDEMIGYDGMADREMAAQVYNDAKKFFATEGAMRDFALQNPGDLVAILLGSAYGVNKLKNISPEKKAQMESIVKRIGATPVGLSMDVNYGGSHRPPGPNGGAPGHNVTTGSDGGVFPNDIYSDKALQYYRTGMADDQKAIDIIQSMKDNPEKEITVYRAVPAGVDTINSGDWVTPVESYAKSHAEDNMGSETSTVISKTVKAKEIFTNGDSIMEWGYSAAEPKKMPFIDAAGTYSKAEQVVQNMPQDSMGIKEVIPFLQNRGILNAEIQDLKIDRFVDDFKGKTVSKEGLLEHIDQNQTQLLSTSLLSPNNTYQKRGDHIVESADNTIYVSDPEQAYEYLGRGFHENAETPDGFITVTRNQDEIDEFASGFLNNIQGSFEVSSNNVAEARSHYPYNFNPNDQYYDPMKPESGLRQDITTGFLMRSLHELNPDKYPMTTGIQALNNYYTAGSRVDRVTPEEKENALKDTSSKLSILENQNKQGIDEWDQKLAKQWSAKKFGRQYFNDFDNPGPIPADVMQDIETVVNEDAEMQYLANPQFEQTIPITTRTGDVVNYTVTGRESDGYFVYNPNGSLVADSVDLPQAQFALNRDAQIMDYIRNEDVGLFNQAHETSSYHNYLSSKDNKWVDTYSEELISLVPNTNKKSAYYEVSRIGGEGYIYTQGHYGDKVDNTLISHRKVVVPNTAVKKADGTATDTGVYKIVEMQSDWIQDGRQYGFTEEEHNAIGDKLLSDYQMLDDSLAAINVVQDSMSELDDMDSYDGYEAENALAMAEASLQDIPNFIFKQSAKADIKAMAHKGIVNQFSSPTSSGQMGLSTATMNSPEYQRELDKFDESAKRIDKMVDEGWADSPLNPESDAFDIHEFYDGKDIYKVQTFISDYLDHVDTKVSRHDDHEPSPRKPLASKDVYISTGLQDAVAKAHAQGLKYVSWSTGKQILDRWNKNRELDFKGNTQYKELYSNMYDKKIPKAAKQFLRKYGGEGETLQEMEVDGEMQYVIEITDELIKNLKKEFDIPADSKVLPMPKYGKTNIPSGLLQTDIINQEGLLA